MATSATDGMCVSHAVAPSMAGRPTFCIESTSAPAEDTTSASAPPPSQACHPPRAIDRAAAMNAATAVRAAITRSCVVAGREAATATIAETTASGAKTPAATVRTRSGGRPRRSRHGTVPTRHAARASGPSSNP
jgi:hypothetical protein